MDVDFSQEIPSILLAVWNLPSSGRYGPKFRQNVKVVEGVLRYEAPEEWLSARNREMKNAK